MHIGNFRVDVWEGTIACFIIIIRDVFPHTWLAEADMAKITVVMYYVFLTKVTSNNVLSTVAGIHLFEKKP